MENEIAKVCVWRECRHEPSLGQQGVIHVINNRSKKQQKSYYDIATASMQFSSMTYKADPQLSLYPSSQDIAFLNICHWIDIVFLDSTILPDPTEGATFYRNPKTATSIWFDNAIRDGKLVKTVTIGNHDFFKEV